MDTKDYYNTCEKCGRPIQYATEPKCNYCDACMNEYCGCKLGRIKEIEPTCDSTAVIPSITVESVEGITNLANCLVHVNDINTTFYVDDKHRVMITWAGPVDIPGYDMENNPNGYRDQIITDIEKGIAVIYDRHGKGFTFGIYQSLDADGSVTQAINDKLDEMAADGTLEDIIATYMDDVIHGFNTVADMEASTELIDGDYTKTLGYYALNDQGGAYYKISSTAPSGYYETLANGLYARLIIEASMNVKQFGARGDGSADDTAKIQSALDNSATILVPGGVYMINAITKISLNSHNKLVLDNDATIKALPNNVGNYAVLEVRDVTDVEICGGTIEGERNEHTGTTGEWGMCISIVGSSNKIYVHDINLTDAWGDGIYVNTTGSVNTARVYVNNARRNGYSIISVDNFYSDQDHIENTNGTMPQAGVDIEPNNNTDILNNIVFNNLTTNNNASSGVGILVGNLNTEVNIKLINLKSNNNNRGLWVETRENTIGKIDVIDALIEDTNSSGIYMMVEGDKFACNFIRPVVRRYGASSTSSCGIMVGGTNLESTHGNITFFQPEIVDPIISGGTPLWAIGFYFSSGILPDNIKIIDPVNLYGRGIRGLGGGTNIKITDRFEVLKIEPTSNYTIEGDYLKFLILGTNYTVDRTVTFRDGNVLPIGYEFTFINTGSKKMNITFPNQYIYPLSVDPNKTVTLNDKGSSIKVRRIAQDEWTVISQTGDITAS